mmetsp:Transcript_76532/g.135144  ORF Transcript_76532/g.135144 Transcript_76532/m.135144 type:complete len:225 (-) Transcript_76532:486-1160(-)
MLQVLECAACHFAAGGAGALGGFGGVHVQRILVKRPLMTHVRWGSHHAQKPFVCFQRVPEQLPLGDHELVAAVEPHGRLQLWGKWVSPDRQHVPPALFFVCLPNRMQGTVLDVLVVQDAVVQLRSDALQPLQPSSVVLLGSRVHEGSVHRQVIIVVHDETEVNACFVPEVVGVVLLLRVLPLVQEQLVVFEPGPIWHPILCPLVVHSGHKDHICLPLTWVRLIL